MAAEAKTNNDDDEKKPKSVEEMFKLYAERHQAFEDKIVQFPVDTNNILTAPHFKTRKKEIYDQMRTTYPMCHGGVLLLIYQFLLAKRKYGSELEKKVYENLTITGMLHRIFTKRAVVFYQQYDSYMLRNGQRGNGRWQLVGKDNHHNVSLKDYLSYDEILLSALCGVSSPTFFINNGRRANCGSIDDDDDDDDEDENDENSLYPMPAVYMGLIGARFESPQVMEYKLMIVQKDQNVDKHGYGQYGKHKDPSLHRLDKAIDGEYFLQQIEASKGKFQKGHDLTLSIFEQFYSRMYFPVYAEIDELMPNDQQDPDDDEDDDDDDGNNNNEAQSAKKDKNDKNEEEKKQNDALTKKQVKQRYFRDDWGYGKLKPFMDVEMFRQRIRVSLELFLFDSDARSKQAGKRGFCHLVGLGSGYWAFHKTRQDVELVQVALDIIASSDLSNIACLYFSWFSRSAEQEALQGALAGKEAKSGNEREYEVEDKCKNKIVIQFGNRNPADRLEESFKKCLICACYAWDGNSFPGNEYWFGGLSASGDPAAAACSLISWSQNSEINQEYVNGENTAIYFYDSQTGKYEIVKAKDISFANDAKFEKDKEEWLKRSAMSIPYKREKFVNANNDKK